MLYLLAALNSQAAVLNGRLGKADLVTDEGRLRAIQDQGKLAGLGLAIQAIFTLAEEEFKQDE